MSMFLCRKMCGCCYSEKNKNATNPVTLTRAETITVQPTTSAALEMQQVNSDEIKPATLTKKPTTIHEDKISVTSDLDEIDLDETIPTDEDLQPAPIPPTTAADHTFAAAVTDMMLDEIDEKASVKEAEISEEPLKIDNNVVAEATDEEVRNTLTRPPKKAEKIQEIQQQQRISPIIVEKLNFDELHQATGHESYQNKADLQPSLPSPEKPPRQSQILVSTSSLEPEKDIQDKIAEEKEIKDFVKIKKTLAAENNDENNDPSNRSIATQESEIDTHTPEISCLDESEATEAPINSKILQLTKAPELDRKMYTREESEEEEEEESIRSATSEDHSDYIHIKKTFHGNIKDEKAEVEIFENRQVIIHDDTLPKNSGAKHRGQSETSKPPEIYPKPTMSTKTSSNMYGNISDDSSNESNESSESEAESLDVPRKKPNRVSVKQTNVVLTKVTAVDALQSETSETESPLSSPRNHYHRNNQHQNNHQHENDNYVVLTDDEFSEKII